jgi:hypothetical protein
MKYFLLIGGVAVLSWGASQYGKTENPWWLVPEALGGFMAGVGGTMRRKDE